MRVALVTTTLNEVGGVQTFNDNIIRILEKRGHEVSGVTLDLLDTKPKKEERVVVLGEYFNKINKTKNYDLVICNGEFGYSVKHPKAINVLHGGYYGYAMALKDLVPEEVTNERLKNAEMQKVSAEGKYVVTVSNFAKEMLKEFGMKVDRVINLSSDTNVFYPNDSFGRLETSLAVTRGMYYEKGFDILKEMVDKGIKLKLFSDFSIDSPLVENKGFIEHNGLRREYNQARVFLNPTRFEGGGLTTLEAMACGCPVLTTPTGYGRDIKDVIPDFVVARPDDINDWLAKMKKLVSDRENYSRQALEYFWKFHNPNDFENNWVSLVEGL